MKLYHLYFIQIFFEISSLVSGNLDKKLKYYEIIDVSNIKHVKKRSIHEDQGHTREITLPTIFGRTFELSLVPKPELFSDDFKAFTVDKNGKETEFMMNKYDFYRGFVKGEEKQSFVTLQLDEDMITAAIETQEDTYHLEPLTGHRKDNTENKMLAYRDSDIIWNATFAGNHTKEERFCGLHADDNAKTSHTPRKERERRSTRTRRSVKIKRECGLMLVADYLYFRNIGQNDRKKTQNSMVGVIHRVDEIFKSTEWSIDPRETYNRFGFFIKKILIHEEQSFEGYNKQPASPPWAIGQLLEEFSRNDWSKFCLAHLFTHQDFDKGVIGLAYVAHPERNSKGGICSEGTDDGLWHNTGLSSTKNWGNQLLTAEADIVTAHEFGHNFGSAHDVQTDRDCSPEYGGKFIMYPASVSGQKPNNMKFSKCSREAVLEVIKKKANECFSVPSGGTFCGNYRVDKDEKCDPGDNANDPCCNSDCELKVGAKCSDSNSPCCSSCQFASNATLCAQAQPLLCKKEVYCLGWNDSCPNAKPADEGTPCIESGKCNKDGKCEPFCKVLGPDYKPCLCTDEVNACYVCCQKGNDTCQVHQNETSPRKRMSNGRLCYDGVCVNGECKKDAVDFITRLQNFFETLGNPSKFGEFLKDNIVGTVIFFSLVLWIPLGIVVNRIDKRRDKQAQELARWQDMGNQDLIRQRNRRRDNFDVVFKKDAVFLRDSRKAKGRGLSPVGPRGPTVES